jgi:hypothetical protein
MRQDRACRCRRETGSRLVGRTLDYEPDIGRARIVPARSSPDTRSENLSPQVLAALLSITGRRESRTCRLLLGLLLRRWLTFGGRLADIHRP